MTAFNVKSMCIYRMSRSMDLSGLSEQLEHFKYSPCGSQDLMKTGFIPPLGKHSDEIQHVASGQHLISIMKENKILPSAVIKSELQAKIDKLESEQHRRLKKTERDSLRDEVVHSLLPRAFSKYLRTDIWINQEESLITVLTASRRHAENCLALLRKALGSLPVIPFTTKELPEMVMTDWVKNDELPNGFIFGEKAELKSLLGEGGIARFSNQDLISDDVLSNIDSGKMITKLSLNYDDRIQFTITDNFIFTGIKFSDDILDKNDDIDREDFAQRFDADFFLITSELKKLITTTASAFGGEAKL
ncbi:recombination-associated protein RdgC [Morganella morganii]|uniref:recombination-associated protein RdgC n=1 Tax=Morganella morganii TaxID=582 RepID=UPI0029EF1B99|nr:recombination-associated protein RdgC [Morganella morganii]HCR3554407.1 recombination-associated protein RdgC [Morganella morganii]HCR3762658.1 recombination-associated protein RdgC [Morganella morganii]